MEEAETKPSTGGRWGRLLLLLALTGAFTTMGWWLPRRESQTAPEPGREAPEATMAEAGTPLARLSTEASPDIFPPGQGTAKIPSSPALPVATAATRPPTRADETTKAPAATLATPSLSTTEGEESTSVRELRDALQAAWPPAEPGAQLVICLDQSRSTLNRLRELGHSLGDLNKALGAELMARPRMRGRIILFARGVWPSPDSGAAGPALATWLEEHARTDGRSGPDWERPTPDGWQAALEMALASGPMAVWVIGDGSFQRTRASGRGEDVPWNEVERRMERQRARTGQVPALHGLFILPREEDLEGIEAVQRRFGGQLQVLNKRGP